MPLMKNRSQNPEAPTDSRLEHMTATTEHGEVRWHFIRPGKADVSGASYGVDWWRNPQAPKGLLNRLFRAKKPIVGIATLKAFIHAGYRPKKAQKT